MSSYHQPIPLGVPSQAYQAIQEAISAHAEATTQLQAIGARLTMLAAQVAALEAQARQHIPSG